MTPTHGQIEAREQRQLGGIERGRQTGAITWRESLKLRSEQRRIARTEGAFEVDGRLTKSERRNLDRLQDRAHYKIQAEKHDGWHRAWWQPRDGR